MQTNAASLKSQDSLDRFVRRFVEADVAVPADAQKLQVETSVRRDPRFKFGRGSIDKSLGNRAVEHVRPVLRCVDIREQVFMHIIMIASLVKG